MYDRNNSYIDITGKIRHTLGNLTVLSLTTVTQLQSTVLQHPTTIAEQPKCYNVQLRRANIQITKHLTLAILLVMLFQASNIA